MSLTLALQNLVSACDWDDVQEVGGTPLQIALSQAINALREKPLVFVRVRGGIIDSVYSDESVEVTVADDAATLYQEEVEPLSKIPKHLAKRWVHETKG